MVKTDPTDRTISLSNLIVKPFNADFDGDELNMALILETEMYDALERLAPYHSAMDLEKPRAVSGDIWIPGPVLSTINNFLGGSQN